MKHIYKDYKDLTRSIPSVFITFFTLSVLCMNILANKELITFKYLALDCGILWSWVGFLCMDIICKRFGAIASIKISLVSILINFFACLLFKISAMAPGKWGEYYSSGCKDLVNTSLNNTFGGSWYILLISSFAMFLGSVTNSFINVAIGKLINLLGGFKEFAIRSYISTFFGQIVDNLSFTMFVSKILFGWTWTQVIVCSITGACCELLFEIVFSPIGYKISKSWEKDGIGKSYLRKKAEEK